MTFKKAIGFLHLWLGLLSGIVVFLISITGCLYAFKSEIEDLTQPYRFVKEEAKPFLPPSTLKQLAIAAVPNKHPHSVEYEGNLRAAKVAFYNEEPHYYYIAFINPYSGEVLKVKDMDKGDFFGFVLDGHFNLWLPNKIGQPVVASATLIFVVMLITGIILWWPKNKNAAKQRFWFRWKQKLKWKRKNYDLHNILGFYASWVVVILALTGLVWGFEWFAHSVYWISSGGKEVIEYYEPVSDTTKTRNTFSAVEDKVYQLVNTKYPAAASIEVHYPENTQTAIAASANPEHGTYWKNDYLYFDQRSLAEIEVKHPWGKFKNTSTADKIMRMNYDVHVGAIWGLAGKCLAFFVSLISASLPVTGFFIWLGRRKAKKQKA